MGRPAVRVGSSRAGRGAPSVSALSPQTYQGTYSGYGATHGESVGVDARAFAYKTGKAFDKSTTAAPTFSKFTTPTGQ